MPTTTSSALAQGPRVFLRELTAEDEAEFTRLVRESRRLHRPWVSPPDNAQGFQQYLARVGPSFKALAVCLREDGSLAGVFNMSQIVFGLFRNAYLGYYTFEHSAKQGYMTEGLELVLRYAFRTLKLHRLEANIQPGNVDSIRLVKRCGFVREGFSPAYLKIRGRWRDHERWAIRTELWRAPRGRGVSPRASRSRRARATAP